MDTDSLDWYSNIESITETFALSVWAFYTAPVAAHNRGTRNKDMTTRGIRPGDDSAIESAIARLLRVNENLSKRQITARLRAQGFKVGNERARVLVDLTRAAVERGIVGGAVGSNDTRLVFDMKQVLNIQGSDNDLTRGQRRRITQAFRAVNLADPSEKVNVKMPTHLLIDWTGTFTANVFFYGKYDSTLSDTFSGRFTQPFGTLERDYIESKIHQMVQGKIAEIISAVGDTFIEGMSVEMTALDVSINKTEIRGTNG